MRILRLFLIAFFVASFLATAACGGTEAPTAATSRITPPATVTETFAGTLQVQGSGFYSFVVGQFGASTSLILAAVQTPNGAALTTVVGLGVGVPSGTGCARTTSLNTRPGLAAQVTTTLKPGTYCASVYDVGNLTGAVNFAMRIIHP